MHQCAEIGYIFWLFYKGVFPIYFATSRDTYPYVSIRKISTARAREVTEHILETRNIVEMLFKATSDIDCSQMSAFKVGFTSRKKTWSWNRARLKSCQTLYCSFIYLLLILHNLWFNLIWIFLLLEYIIYYIYVINN